MALFISKGHLFKPESENHYKLHNRIDSTQYPQYHDFYEIVLVTSGILKLTLCGQKFSLQQGSLVFIRPNDIHSKSGKNCSHINLAFPIETIDALFLYLCDINCKNNMESALYIPPCLLSQEDYQTLLERINKLNSIESNDWRQTRTFLRAILLDIITCHIYPMFVNHTTQIQLPFWLADALKEWNKNRQQNLSFFCTYSGYTKEHICRTFKRYLGVSPAQYLNDQRLSHAIHLLLHSDYQMIDIAYESGFSSLSRFYHLFHEKYNISPKQFQKQNLKG